MNAGASWASGDFLLFLHADCRLKSGSLHAIEHGMIALLPLFVLGDRRDVGGVSLVPYHPQTQAATIFIYDGYPGGIGYSEEAYRQWEALAKATLMFAGATFLRMLAELVQTCTRAVN